VQTFDKIERLNPDISINVWEWREKVFKSPKCIIYSKNYNRPHIINLIALTEVEEVTNLKVKHHFIWVKDILDALLYGDSTLHKANCNKCTQTFPSREKLDIHRDWCHGLDNIAQMVEDGL
jgi:hypothetical protein